MSECEDMQELIAARNDGELDVETTRLFEEHLRNCAACRRELDWEERLQRLLRRLPEPQVPAGFEERAFARLYSSERPRRIRTAAVWALAASLLIGVGVWMGTTLVPRESEPFAGGLTLAADTVTTIHLAFNAKHQVDEVLFVLSVPDGFEIQGHPGQRHIEWRGQLKAGRNLMKLPIKAGSDGDGILIATLQSNGKQKKVFKVHLTTEGEAVGNGQLSKLKSGLI